MDLVGLALAKFIPIDATFDTALDAVESNADLRQRHCRNAPFANGVGACAWWWPAPASLTCWCGINNWPPPWRN